MSFRTTAGAAIQCVTPDGESRAKQLEGDCEGIIYILFDLNTLDEDDTEDIVSSLEVTDVVISKTEINEYEPVDKGNEDEYDHD